MNPTIQLIMALAPTAIPLIANLAKDIEALVKAHPALTPDLLAQLVAAIHGENIDTLATIAADQATAPPVPGA